MSQRPVDESQVRAIAAQIGERDRRMVAVAGAPTWEGPERLETDAGTVRVLAAPSTLAVRAALVAHRAAGDHELLVVVTDRDERELGEEVVAELWDHRVVRPYGWEACKRLFRAEMLDGQLADDRWLVDLLVDHAPPRGYPPVAKGVLDADTAWRAFCRHGLGLRVDRPSTLDLLRWAEAGEGTKTLGRLSDDDRARVIDRLVRETDPGALPILRLAADGRGPRAVGLGLLAGVLWSPEAVGEAAATARGRFTERQEVLQGPDPERRARGWARAAEALARERLADADPNVPALLADVEHQLDQLGASALVGVSDLLPGALAARLATVGTAITETLDGHGTVEAALRALGRVQAHVRADEDPQAARATHAVRLAARAQGPATSSEAADLADAARRWIDDGAWVDEARAAIAEGATVPELASALSALLARIDAEREPEDRAFAAQLADWSRVEPLGAQGLLPIERVLDDVVAPLAAQRPTLVLVVDGLDHPTAHRLLGDIEREGWAAQEPADAPWPAVVSALPSITYASRASLLSGRLVAGEQNVERDNFAAHAALRKAGGEPRLFHKRDLKPEEGRLGEEVRDAITDVSRRVVGVVVNGVDDHLDKGGQLQLVEGLHGVRPLAWLLQAAAEAGRVVVVTSDHGHIRARRTKTRVTDGGGERWRPATSEPNDDEVAVAGPRVLRGEGEVVLPATDAIRYTPADKLGYHGGATPQEVLCPLAVFAPASAELDGYAHVAVTQPPWWWDVRPDAAARSEPDVEAAAPAAPAPAAPAPPSTDPDGGLRLFDDEETASAEPQETSGEAEAAGAAARGGVAGQPAWVTELLASPLLAEQRARAGRAALSDDDLAAFLAVLARHGDVATAGVLQRETGVKGVRLRSKLQALRRTLSVDAYDVVRVDTDGTVRLNRQLLAEQFQLEQA
ncbi:BREX-2 system phosphatase PglZ [Egibacter rhizosphaerae]|uniref:BREX-2 system phosphatase PglZ n=1 Tax=Egibacter rhizosphaerae TaxID=1670831 RepID=UPI0013F15F16|nr:BREX-2 system phosphatase PglZ [Egibacter rhizosphaerae]